MKAGAELRQKESPVGGKFKVFFNHSSVESFRGHLVDQEQELILLREENLRLKNISEADRRRIKDLEDRLVNAETANNSLQRRVQASKLARVDLENEVGFGLETSCSLKHIP